MLAQSDAPQDTAAGLMPPTRPMAPWRVFSVATLSDFRLRVRFNDGIEGTIDMTRLIHSPEAGIFAALRDARIFRQAHVMLGAVTWPGEIDLAPDAMHRAIKSHGHWVI